MQNPFDWNSINTIVNSQLYKGKTSNFMEKSLLDLTKVGNSFFNSKLNPKLRILEIGAGSGELFPFIKTNFSEYLMSDISNWGIDKIKNLQSNNSKIKFELQDIQNLKLDDNSFHWTLVSCVLAHVDEPFLSFQELKRVTKSGGG